MRKSLWLGAIAGAMMTMPLLGVDDARSAPGSVRLVAGSLTKRTLLFDRRSNGGLDGLLSVALINGDKKRATLAVRYLATDGVEPAKAGIVNFSSRKAPVLAPGIPTSVSLRFSLPRNGSPANLAGVLAFELRRDGKPARRRPVRKSLRPRGPIVAVGKPLLLQVKGAADPLSGVTVLPESATAQYTSWGGPFSRGHSTSLKVQLRGPGVPSLFSAGRALPQPRVPLGTSSGAELQARLEQLRQTGDPAVANAVLKVTGELDPGSYSGVVPLSDLSAAAPRLPVKLQARDGFLWALLAAFIGALIGGFWYLASSRRRRKDLLKAYVLDLLDRYSKRLRSLKRGHPAPQMSAWQRLLDRGHPDGQLPVWQLATYLGKPERWYRVKWSAAPELDGVGGIWSTIFWARNDQDLDQAAIMVGGFRQRLIRWLRVAAAVRALREVDEMKPDNPISGSPWERTKTVGDTRLLLKTLRRLEPPDDATIEVLLGRINRQARWHAVFARTWHTKSRVEAYNAQHRDEDVAESLGEVDLKEMDKDASPEKARTDEGQFIFEQQLDDFQGQLEKMYKGPEPSQLEMSKHEAPSRAVAIGQLSATQARPGSGAGLALIAEGAETEASDSAEPSPPPSEDQARAAGQVKPPGSVRQVVGRLTGPVRRVAARRVARVKRWAGRPDRKGQAGTIISALVHRDLAWTVMIAFVATAAYVPLLYDSTWGSLGDYGSAFAAGFLGKVAINWALLPAFQSLGLTAPAVTGLNAPAPAPGSTVTTTTTTTTPGGSLDGAASASKGAASAEPNPAPAASVDAPTAHPTH